MPASALDLRYKTKQIIQALERNEEVRIFYRGKLKGIIQAVEPERKAKSLSDHPFFGMSCDARQSVDEVMSELRQVRTEESVDAL
ncbi:MAG: type II toxin-antitoxin system Phd/YefM family antitoxin [Desulfovibrionales bacterium]|nr:MAG: type II toxin-antitoxin system Phd/YefM family antitoxin [Desulfovibrionales bacterium]